MPIRPELRALYPRAWRELSHRVRFERALARSAQEFAVNIRSYAGSLINDGERLRAGEHGQRRDQKRFAKRRQMQWARRGAPLLLQTRTRALDGMLRPLFDRWHPGQANDNPDSASQVV